MTVAQTTALLEASPCARQHALMLADHSIHPAAQGGWAWRAHILQRRNPNQPWCQAACLRSHGRRRRTGAEPCDGQGLRLTTTYPVFQGQGQAGGRALAQHARSALLWLPFLHSAGSGCAELWKMQPPLRSSQPSVPLFSSKFISAARSSGKGHEQGLQRAPRASPGSWSQACSI